MKKIEAWLIKRLLSISWRLLVETWLVEWWPLFHTLGDRFFLENSWRVWHTWILGARRKGKSRKALKGIRINNYIRFVCRYRVSCMFPSLALVCMAYACGLLVVTCHWHGGWPRLIVDCLALPFPGYPWWLWVYFLVLFLVGSHVSLVWVELSVL